MIYLISYDIKEYNKEDDERVIAFLKQSGAVRCLLSEWLLDDDESAEDITTAVWGYLGEGDRLLVVRIADFACMGLLNSEKSIALLNRS